MYDLEEQVKQLKDTIFNMLNFTNFYIIVLNEKMEIKFINNSLARDLGFESYKDIISMNWIDFVDDKEKTLIKKAHKAISEDSDNWEHDYKEFQNFIKTRNDKLIPVYWFNSHINTNYNWTFSFGIKKQQDMKVNINSMRTYYQNIINKDRIMINSMRDILGIKNKYIDSDNSYCVGIENETSLSF